ncbi:MAG: aldehyde dehydrogenase family protein [Planctomycetota bacterium]
MLVTRIANWIDGREQPALNGRTFDKNDPATGRLQSQLARSDAEDVAAAVVAAQRAWPAWANATAVKRGEILRKVAQLMEARREALASIVARETGKSFKDAFGETGAAIEMGYFMAGEGRRFYGRTTTSAVPGKQALTLRQPIGIAGLIIAANTPVANVAWKAFPALICGNSVVLKAAEDTPEIALRFAQICHEAGVPPGVFNVIEGVGAEAGAALVAHPEVALISFTGSCAVGRAIAETAGRALKKVCLELGGKNPLIVCDDADLDRAVPAAVQAAFSNAGQRCASGSRLVVFDRVYDEFVARLLTATRALRIGPADSDDFGPVISARQLENMLKAVRAAEAAGAKLLTGGERLTDAQHAGGYYLAPTVLADSDAASEISRTELFGPITTIYRVRGYAEALRVANESPFGLTSAIFTQDVDRALSFVRDSRAGVAVVNGPTFGSEPHLPFGGLRGSGNGTREAGSEALDVYSELKTVYILTDASREG